MHNGMVRKLDFLYVPGLWKNLSSLKTLAKSCLNYFGEYDWVKVSKCALGVMKGNMKHGIYFLEDSFVRGTIVVSKFLLVEL